MSETYEQIVERRRNERMKGIEESIRMWGEMNGQTVKGDAERHATQSEQAESAETESGETE